MSRSPARPPGPHVPVGSWRRPLRPSALDYRCLGNIREPFGNSSERLRTCFAPAGTLRFRYLRNASGFLGGQMRTTLVLALFAGLLAQAQTTTTLLGTVTDKTGGVVPGAEVTATNTGTNQTRT